MIRAFDFTVQEDTTYRYRVRIVVFNPNNGREDVDPDVDTKVRELRGPWSDPPTDQVTMPPDVMPYAIGIIAARPSQRHESAVSGHPFPSRRRRDRPQNLRRRAGRGHRRAPDRRCPGLGWLGQESQGHRLQQPSDRARRFREQKDGRIPAPTRRRSSGRPFVARLSLPCLAARWAVSCCITRPTTRPTRSARTSPPITSTSSAMSTKERKSSIGCGHDGQHDGRRMGRGRDGMSAAWLGSRLQQSNSQLRRPLINAFSDEPPQPVGVFLAGRSSDLSLSFRHPCKRLSLRVPKLIKAMLGQSLTVVLADHVKDGERIIVWNSS